MTGKNRIMIYGAKNDGTAKDRAAAADVLVMADG